MIQRFVRKVRNIPLGKSRIFGVIRRPLSTEKATRSSERGEYVFEVLKSANKFEIKKSIEGIFSVKVADVNTATLKGKRKVFRRQSGQRCDIKKAMVRLQNGFSIELGVEHVS